MDDLYLASAARDAAGLSTSAARHAAKTGGETVFTPANQTANQAFSWAYETAASAALRFGVASVSSAAIPCESEPLELDPTSRSRFTVLSMFGVPRS